MPELVLYTTAGCHLCEQAETLLLTRLKGFSLRRVEIADSGELVETYGLRIPVLGLSGVEAELDWPFSEFDVADFLDSHC